MKYGKIEFILNDLIEERGISKNKLCQLALLQRTQLNKYCNNKVTRIDIPVLERICTVLECEIQDILVFRNYP